MQEYKNGDRVRWYDELNHNYVDGVFIGFAPDGRAVMQDDEKHLWARHTTAIVSPKRTREEIAWEAVEDYFMTICLFGDAKCALHAIILAAIAEAVGDEND